MAKICTNGFSNFLWRLGEPKLTIFESLRLSPENLVAFRVVAFVCCCIGWTMMIIIDGSNHFIFLTYWGVYFDVTLFGLLLFHHSKSSSTQSSTEQTLQPYRHQQLWKFTILVYECAVSFGIMIGVVYWTAIFPRINLTNSEYAIGVVAHGVLPIILIFEFSCNFIPFYKHHYWMALSVGGVYMAWNCIWSLTQYPVYGSATTWRDRLTFFFVFGSFLVGSSAYLTLAKLSQIKENRIREFRTPQEKSGEMGSYDLTPHGDIHQIA